MKIYSYERSIGFIDLNNKRLIDKLSEYDVIEFHLSYSYINTLMTIIGEFSYLSTFDKLKDKIFRVNVRPHTFINQDEYLRIVQATKGIRNFEINGCYSDNGLGLNEWYRPILRNEFETYLNEELNGWVKEDYTDEVIDKILSKYNVTVSNDREILFSNGEGQKLYSFTVFSSVMRDYVRETNLYIEILNYITISKRIYQGEYFHKSLLEFYYEREKDIRKVSRLLINEDTNKLNSLLSFLED